MKNTVLLMLLLIFGMATENYAQVKQLWTRAIPDGVKWQMVTSLGNFVVGTSKGLVGINPDSGEVMWKNEKFGSIPSESVQPFGGSALLMVNLGTTVYILDPFSGHIEFDSKAAGINEIRDQRVLYKSNGLLISGRDANKKDILLMSSLEDGTVAWKIEEDFGRFVTASEISPEELLIVTIFYNYKVNPVSGEIIWKNDVSQVNEQMAKMGALGGLMKQAAANVVQNVEFNVQFYQHPSKPIFYVASEQEGQAETTGFTTTSSTGNAPSYHTTYSAFDLNNGERLWSKPLDIPGKIGGVYFDSKGLVIMPDNGSNTKVNRYDFTTQAGQWGKKGKGVNVKGGIYSFAEAKDGLVLVSQNNGGKNFISYLNKTTGELTFDKPVQIQGELIYSETTPKGLFYLTTEEMNILDITAGKLLFDKGLQTMPPLTVEKESLIYFYDTKEGVLKSLDKNTAALKTLSGPVKFEGKESPTAVELYNDAVLISSSQNLALIDAGGKTVYQKYFEAPREPGIIRALQYAQAVRAAYVSAAAHTASAVYKSAAQQEAEKNNNGSSMLLQTVGNAYGELASSASAFAKKSWAAANTRFKATQNAENYSVVLTKQEKSNVLVKVDKETGAIKGTIDLGKDSMPNYTMDGVTGQVFYSAGNNNIVAYKF